MEKDNISLDYKFESALGRLEANRYINDYQVDIYSEDMSYEVHLRELIGKAEVSLVLLNLVMNQQIPYYEVFDNSQFLSELGEMIIDFDANAFREPLSEEIMPGSGNLLVINRLELLPEWRKKNIGKKIIKDIIWRFSGCCDLIILKAFPLQQEYQYPNSHKTEWEQKMQLHDLSQDEEFSNYKVYAYYQRLGFTQLEKTEYFYLNPAIKNDKFDAIEMNE